MDPNLTLAHITHNTSVILLHQGIAYPSPQWRSCPIRLPSDSSASTCITAASEVSNIVQNFLLHSTTLTNPQFAFCIFMSARVLHAHARYHNVPLSSEFSVLVSSLHEIAQRFSGPHNTTSENLASKFASRLTRAEISVSGNISGPSLDIRQTAYSNPTAPGSPNAVLEDFGNHSPDSISLAFPPLPPSFQYTKNDWSQLAMSTTDDDLNRGIYPELSQPTIPAQMQAQVAFQKPSLQPHADEEAATISPGHSEQQNQSWTNLDPFEQLNRIFNDPYPSLQRISTFTGEQKGNRSGEDGNNV